MPRLKVLLVGPSKAGKSSIANFLSDATESISSDDYRPTQGVRIVEFESNGGFNDSATEVELWDCSGDQRFENCWPCIQSNANAVVFVGNPTEAQHSKDLETWHLHFARQRGLSDFQCLVLNHSKSSSSNVNRLKLSSTFSNIDVVQTNLEDDAGDLRDAFSKFISSVNSKLADKRDAEELSIVNQ